MSDQQRRTLKHRALPFATAALTLGAVLAFSQLGSNLSGGTSAGPAPERSAPVAAAPAKTVITNRNPAATRDYWTKAKMRNAQEALPTRTDGNTESYGTSNLDFTRSRISPQSANTAAPYKATGKLFYTQPGVGDFQCSAAVVAARVIITAAHCVFGTTFYTNWTFIPGYDGSKPTLAQQRPFGTWAWNRAQVPLNWIDTAGALPNATDFATIVLSDQLINGNPTKVSGVAGQYRTVTGHLSDTAVTMLGYPCNLDSCNIMQRVDSSDHREPPGASGSNAFEYGADMTGGSSGGPWIENFGTGALPTGNWRLRNSVVAVTSYGYTDGGSALVLGASQLNADWTTIFNSSCAAAAGNC